MKKHKGFTLVELLLVMAICASLTAVVYAAWHNIQVRLDLQKVQSQVNIIVDAARAWRNAKTSYQGVSITPGERDSLCDDNLLPKDMCIAGFVNPWGGQYRVSVSAKHGDNNFDVTITNVTKPEMQNAIKLILLKDTLKQESVQIDREKIIATFN
ncbi:MAG: type II secretion system protein [Gammaproteobacteria bacterium]|jgi:prepilin-type N-terminal cleavage/methylation domain-containing protein